MPKRLRKGVRLRANRSTQNVKKGVIYTTHAEDYDSNIILNGVTGIYSVSDFTVVPIAQDLVPSELGKYDRLLYGLDGVTTITDVYRVLDAYKVVDPCMQHLVKKALCTGLRGHKDIEQDLQDIIDSAIKAKELFLHKKNHPNPN